MRRHEKRGTKPQTLSETCFDDEAQLHRTQVVRGKRRIRRFPPTSAIENQKM